MAIKLFLRDGNQHHKPHVHVVYGGDYRASVAVDGEFLAGSLPIKQLRLVQAWLILYENEVCDTWDKAIVGEDFGKVDPLS